ncbi:hypothetical protein CK231_21965 [Mesorhizobium loti]|nr:hypothetical protein CK231_21965 [Mesorhizobium loti]PBC07518.1 hypothetical protein CK230_26465 [Mesorhizobium sp. WSM3859]
MTTAAPLARYGAVEGALASGFATAELHHLAGHDPREIRKKLSRQQMPSHSPAVAEVESCSGVHYWSQEISRLCH